MYQGGYETYYVRCLHLSLRRFGAPASQLYWSLLRPCHKAWMVTTRLLWACVQKTQRRDTGPGRPPSLWLPAALIWVKSPSQRSGPSPSQRSWELRINSREHFKLGQELSFEKWILAINELIFPTKVWIGPGRNHMFLPEQLSNSKMCKFSLCLIHQVNLLPAPDFWSSKSYCCQKTLKLVWRNSLWLISPDISVDICKFQSHWCFMLSFCFSHLIEKRPFCCRAFHECFVSSTDTMIGGQAGRFLESTHLFEESPAVCCFGLLDLAIQQCWITCN
jgi:hypothetical protein